MILPESKEAAPSEQVAKIENKLVGRWLLKPGQFLYSYDPRTNEMKIVKGRNTQFEKGRPLAGEVTARSITCQLPSLEHADLIHSKSSYDPNLLYEMAINDKNAAKKFARRIIEATKQMKQNEK